MVPIEPSSGMLSHLVASPLHAGAHEVIWHGGDYGIPTVLRASTPWRG